MRTLFVFLLLILVGCKTSQQTVVKSPPQKPKVSKITVELENGQTKDYYIELIQ